MPIFLIILALIFGSSSAYSLTCKKGIRCGNACISAQKTCRSGIGEYSDVSINNQKTAASSTQGKSKEGKQYTVRPTGLNMRISPRAGTTITHTLAQGDLVKVLTDSGDWVYVMHNNQSGWVLAAYLDHPSSKQELSKSDFSCLITASLAPIFSEPDFNSKVIAVASKGITLDCGSRVDNWIQFIHKGVHSWARYVDVKRNI